uniref:Uncharacterized protein n=1 Tax=Ananas comosus var. bracteatus TaxID=296719 RepID=A0A6V7NVU8_ANACO|nr:unnamed protein product [Ananas comosus var. bracteatus]
MVHELRYGSWFYGSWVYGSWTYGSWFVVHELMVHGFMVHELMVHGLWFMDLWFMGLWFMNLWFMAFERLRPERLRATESGELGGARRRTTSAAQTSSGEEDSLGSRSLDDSEVGEKRRDLGAGIGEERRCLEHKDRRGATASGRVASEIQRSAKSDAGDLGASVSAVQWSTRSDAASAQGSVRSDAASGAKTGEERRPRVEASRSDADELRSGRPRRLGVARVKSAGAGYGRSTPQAEDPKWNNGAGWKFRTPKTCFRAPESARFCRTTEKSTLAFQPLQITQIASKVHKFSLWSADSVVFQRRPSVFWLVCDIGRSDCGET